MKVSFQQIAVGIPDLDKEYMDAVRILRNPKDLDNALAQIQANNAGFKRVLVPLSWIVADRERAKLYWQHVHTLGLRFLDGQEIPPDIPVTRTEEVIIIEMANSPSFVAVSSLSESIDIARRITKLQEVLSKQRQDSGRIVTGSFNEASQYKLIAQLHHFMYCNSDRAPFSGLISEMVEWYRPGHWSDEVMHVSRFAMEPVVRLALETAGSFSNPHTLKLALQYAHSCKLMKLDDRRRWIMDEIQKLPDLPQEKQARAILLEYTDGMLKSQAGEGQLAPEGLLERMKVETPIVQACVWRCAACLSLAYRSHNRTAFFIEMSRKAFKLAASTNQSSMSDEDKIIPLYLDTIDLISEVEEQRKIYSRHIERLNETIVKVRKADNKAFTFIMGLIDLKIRLTIGMEAGFDEPILYETYQKITGNHEAMIAVESLNQMAVKDFCFFDIKAIQSRLDKW